MNVTGRLFGSSQQAFTPHNSKESRRTNLQSPKQDSLPAQEDSFTFRETGSAEKDYVLDRVSLSSHEVDVPVSESRSEKLARLRAAISAGTYSVSSADVAEAMLKKLDTSGGSGE